MKTIGLLGGMSWESSAWYYRHLNQIVKDELGGLHSARCILHSFDFAEVVALQEAGRWDKAAELLANAAKGLEANGCDAILICTNTMHVVHPEVQRAVSVPVLHIVDETAAEIRRHSFRTVGLLGTRYTMEQPFYRNRLKHFGIEALVPEESERARVHEIIFGELCRGELNPASKAELLRIVEGLRVRGAEGIIMGCTEIPLLLQPGDGPLPLFDTTWIHAKAAVAFALEVKV
jgi:aspartate racemase